MPQFIFDETEKVYLLQHGLQLKRACRVELQAFAPHCQMKRCMTSTSIPCDICYCPIPSHSDVDVSLSRTYRRKLLSSFQENDTTHDYDIGPPPRLDPVLYRQHAVDVTLSAERIKPALMLSNDQKMVSHATALTRKRGFK